MIKKQSKCGWGKLEPGSRLFKSTKQEAKSFVKAQRGVGGRWNFPQVKDPFIIVGKARNYTWSLSAVAPTQLGHFIWIPLNPFVFPSSCTSDQTFVQTKPTTTHTSSRCTRLRRSRPAASVISCWGTMSCWLNLTDKNPLHEASMCGDMMKPPEFGLNSESHCDIFLTSVNSPHCTQGWSPFTCIISSFYCYQGHLQPGLSVSEVWSGGSQGVSESTGSVWKDRWSVTLQPDADLFNRYLVKANLPK